MHGVVLTVSYGTENVGEIAESIVPVEAAIAKALPGYRILTSCLRAEGLSGFRQCGTDAALYEESLCTLRKSGAGNICILPLFISRGRMYEKVVDAASPLPVAGPLIETEEDLKRISAVYARIARESGRELLLMGHGSDAPGGNVYRCLADVLPENVHLACLKGGPCLEDVIGHLDADRDRILLMPLMLTAGQHARKEMAGDGRDSWKGILEARGFDVRVRLEGMGSLSDIQKIFAEKACLAAKKSE